MICPANCSDYVTWYYVQKERWIIINKQWNSFYCTMPTKKNKVTTLYRLYSEPNILNFSKWCQMMENGLVPKVLWHFSHSSLTRDNLKTRVTHGFFVLPTNITVTPQASSIFKIEGPRILPLVCQCHQSQKGQLCIYCVIWNLQNTNYMLWLLGRLEERLGVCWYLW